MNVHTQYSPSKTRTFLSLRAGAYAGMTTLAASLSFYSVAEVKSLTSSELTETYIKDSTIIVTPKKKKEDGDKKNLSSITISAGEPERSEEDELLEYDQASNAVNEQNEGAILNAEEQLRDLALSTQGPLIEALRPEIPDITPPENRPPIFDQIPIEDNFVYAPLGNDLGISRNEDQLTFSFGNLPGVNTINMPNGINEGPVLLVPRDGGGFDLTIDIPKN